VPADQTSVGWKPSTEVERAAVQRELETLLATPLFHSSKRYPSFLKYVVTRVLAGQTDQLKERILGVEVFGRPADYDTNKDPIVRVTAAEIRKRIEQYYHDAGHDHEIRLVLPSGSYVPHFSWPGRTANGSADLPDLSGHASTTMEAQATSPRSARSRFSGATIAVLSVIGLGIVAVAGFISHAGRPSVTKRFWEPFVNSTEPALFCIADQSEYSTIRLRDAANPLHQITLPDKMDTLIIDDVVPLVNIAGLLRSYGKTYRVLGESTTSLTDLRRGPSVFIGAFDNTWTLRLTFPLRFHFANDPDMNRLWIEDRANPSKREWVLNRPEQQQTGTYKDAAIVTRFVDPTTDQLVVVAAGIGRGGTVAAGEFLVDPQRMSGMLSQVPSDWTQRNLEIVLETQVIEGRSGPPRISAVYVW